MSSGATVGGLFDGCGLLAYGLTLAGWEHRWLCESDRWRRELLGLRWRGVPVIGDVRAVGADSVPRVDLIAGGFPCKGASTAGKRTGLAHPETGLWREMARAIGELRPRWVLVENVANILAIHDGALWGEVLGDLAEIGYDCQWDCIPAAAFGAPHLRDRVIAVAADTDQGGWGAEAGLDSWPSGAPGIDGAIAQRDGEGAQDADVGTLESGRLRRRAGAGDQAAAAAAEGEHRQAGPAEAGPLGRAAGGGDVAAADTGGIGGRLQPQPERGGGDSPRAGPAGEAPADACGGRQHEQPQLDGAPRGGLEVGTGDDAERRGTRVEWGEYGPAIRRWEQVHGPAPEPLVRRVDDRRARRVERSRLSALGDGVQVQLGRLVGEYLLGLHRGLA